MVFSSLIFLWGFLPVVFILYFFMPDKCKNLFLLFASLFFYAWGEPKYIFCILVSIMMNWLVGLLMEKWEKQKGILLIFAVIFNLAILVYFKYFNFIFNIFGKLIHREFELVNIVLPIGISFFTFQILSYIIDLYRGYYTAQHSIVNFAMYVLFFPQLIAGPIVKYKDIVKQLKTRVVSCHNIAEGIRRFIYDFGKKVIIANTVAEYVDMIYGLEYHQLTGTLAWYGAILYMLQIYFDFSGYSDMAIGLGKMFGFTFLENFNYPYLSRSIQEFWQRWHISLGTWFKEYVYIPLGGNRKGYIRTYMNLFIVFLLTGLWHGADYTFILWGMYHGLFQILERLGLRKILDKHKWFAHGYTLTIVLFGWVLFRADSLHHAGVIIKRMIFPFYYTETAVLTEKLLGGKTVVIAVLGVLGCGIMQRFFAHRKIALKWKNSFAEMGFCTFVLIVAISMLASNTYNPFIYFRF